MTKAWKLSCSRYRQATCLATLNVFEACRSCIKWIWVWSTRQKEEFLIIHLTEIRLREKDGICKTICMIKKSKIFTTLTCVTRTQKSFGNFTEVLLREVMKVELEIELTIWLVALLSIIQELVLMKVELEVETILDRLKEDPIRSKLPTAIIIMGWFSW